MAKRYELSDASWELIKDLVSPEQKMGRPRSDDRLVLHGILWTLCSGAAWRDLRKFPHAETSWPARLFADAKKQKFQRGTSRCSTPPLSRRRMGKR